jgi:hypothetical protein
MLAIAAQFLASRPISGIILVVAVFLYQVLIVTVPPIPLGVLIYPADIVSVLLFVVGILRCTVGKRKLKGMQWIPIALLVLFLISLTRGLGAFGLKEAGNESREWFYFLSGVLYFSTFKLNLRLLKRLITIWMVASVILVGIAVFRWLATVAGLSIVAQWQVQGASSIRVLNAEEALFLAVAFFASIFMSVSRTGPHWQRKVFYLLGPIILLLQHRTVWGVMIIGSLWLGLQDSRFRKRAIGAIAGIAIIGIVLTVFLFGHQSDIATASLQNSATDDSSFLWRVAGWYELLFNNPALNMLNGIIGQPFGTGFRRVLAGALVEVAPHNWYVQTFLQLGIIGLFLEIGMFMSGIRRLNHMPVQLQKYIYPDARFWSLILLLQLVYFFTYSASFVQSILTGIAIAGFGLKAKSDATVPFSAVPVIPIDPA